MLGDPELARELLGAVAVGPVADEQELARELGADPREHPDHVADALDGAEVADVREDPLALGREGELEVGLVGFAEALEVDEVGHDLDRAADREAREGVVLEARRDGRDGVGGVDPELDHRLEGGVLPDERDVGPVQRRDEGHAQPARAQDLPREERDGGVGDGVVDVQQVELLALDHLDELRRQRGVVGGVLEQRVVHPRHLVVVHVGRVAREARRLAVADEVHVVTAAREREPELGGDDAGAAVGGVAHDPDAERVVGGGEGGGRVGRGHSRRGTRARGGRLRGLRRVACGAWPAARGLRRDFGPGRVTEGPPEAQRRRQPRRRPLPKANRRRPTTPPRGPGAASSSPPAPCR